MVVPLLTFKLCHKITDVKFNLQSAVCDEKKLLIYI